jgi:hypothetical protein
LIATLRQAKIVGIILPVFIPGTFGAAAQATTDRNVIQFLPMPGTKRTMGTHNNNSLSMSVGDLRRYREFNMTAVHVKTETTAQYQVEISSNEGISFLDSAPTKFTPRTGKITKRNKSGIAQLTEERTHVRKCEKI